MIHKPEDPDETRRWEAEKRPRKVEINVSAKTRNNRIVVDGIDVAKLTTAVELRATGGNMPTVALGLIVPDGIEATADNAIVEVSDATRALLLSLGWTPPGASHDAT